MYFIRFSIAVKIQNINYMNKLKINVNVQMSKVNNEIKDRQVDFEE